MKDYYQILGVPSNANISLIKSVYRSLGQIYHPDKYAGDKKYAEEKMKEINEAYSVLSNNTKRKAYDKQYASSSYNNFENNEAEDEENFHKTVKTDWEILTDYYPDIEHERKHLLRINQRLAVNFQSTLIAEKNTKNWKKISKNVVNDYFNRYFGKEKKLHRFVEFILIERNMKVANEINKAVKILGDKDIQVIINKIEDKYSHELRFLSSGLFEHWKKFFSNFDYKDFIQKADFDKWMSYDKKFHDSDNSNYRDMSEKVTTFELLYKALYMIAFVLFFIVILTGVI